MNKNNVILAPHPDDELIGCFSELEQYSVRKVIFFFDCTDVRKKEIDQCAAHYGFEVQYASPSETLDLESSDIVFAPNINDSHPQHKLVNRLAKKLPNKKKYYSVDMNGKYQVLSPSNRTKKKHFLDKFYPSQKQLLSNEKYHLFESIVDDDSFKMIWVTFQKEGIHCYPAALEKEELADVSFLGHPHRHIFHFKVSIEVNHADRDIEFIQFKRWLESLYSSNLLQLNYKSCEMISDELALFVGDRYTDRKLIIEVSEDGENGCTCEYNI